jgi:hypothetical protein
MSRRKVNVECLYCRKEFESTLRWEGLPEKEYCSKQCETDDMENAFDEYGEETFEKFSKGNKTEWH